MVEVPVLPALGTVSTGDGQCPRRRRSGARRARTANCPALGVGWGIQGLGIIRIAIIILVITIIAITIIVIVIFMRCFSVYIGDILG